MRMQRLVSLYRRLLFVFLVLIAAVLLVIMGAQIVMRYGFNLSLIWAEEMCRYLLIWLSFLALAAAHERGEVASVDVFRDWLPRRLGLAVAIFNSLIGAALLLCLAYYGFVYAERVGSQRIPAFRFLLDDLFGAPELAPTVYWVYLALPLGLVLFAVRLFVEVFLLAGLFASGGRATDLRAQAAIAKDA